MNRTEITIQKYQLRFDELNAIKSTIYEPEGFLKLPYEQAKRKFEECLFWFYVDGFSSGVLMTGEDTPMPNGYEFLDIRYPDGETVEEKFRKHFEGGNAEKLATLMDSEAHRMWNTGTMASAGAEIDKETGIPSASTGKPLKKTWRTMMDEKVRDQHWMLEGKTIPMDEEFVTADGDYGLAPGMFQTAENNANCRCILLLGR